ncbi:MAG: hypothetical protein QXI16_03465 [Sulfolobaceae archaeon]
MLNFLGVLALTLTASWNTTISLVGESNTTIETKADYLDYVGTQGSGLPVSVGVYKDLYYANKPSDTFYLIGFRLSNTTSSSLVERQKKVFLSWTNYVGDETHYAYAMPKLFFNPNLSTITPETYHTIVDSLYEINADNMGENFAYIDGSLLNFNTNNTGVFVLSIPNVQRVYEENYINEFPFSNFRFYATILDGASSVEEQVITFFTDKPNVLVRYYQYGLRNFELLPILIYNQNLNYMGVVDVITKINVDIAYDNGLKDGYNQGWSEAYDYAQGGSPEVNLLTTGITAYIGAILMFLGSLSSFKIFGVSITLIVGVITAFGLGFLLIKLLGSGK